MKCPKCYLIHPDTTKKCRCGFEFGLMSSSTPDLLNAESQPNPFITQRGENESNPDLYKTNSRKFSFVGEWIDLFAIYIINSLLIMVTLGVYYFWGKVKIKRFLYSNTEFDSDRFYFHGTGWELFRGGMIALVIFLLYNLAQIYLERYQQQTWAIVLIVVISIIFISLIPIAIVLSRRYYLSRTSYRGIRFSFRGKVWDYVKVLIPGFLLTLVTLGFYYPYFLNNIGRYFVNNSFYGNRSFRYTGKGSEIFKKYLYALILTAVLVGVIVLGVQFFTGFNFQDLKAGSIIFLILAFYLFFTLLSLGWIWYKYWITKYYWNHIFYSDAKFNCTFEFWPYIKLKIGNFFLLIFSLGFLWPWTTVRNIKFLLDHLTADGDLNFEEILQEIRATSATGESIADFLDIDAGIDLGI